MPFKQSCETVPARCCRQLSAPCSLSPPRPAGVAVAPPSFPPFPTGCARPRAPSEAAPDTARPCSCRDRHRPAPVTTDTAQLRSRQTPRRPAPVTTGSAPGAPAAAVCPLTAERTGRTAGDILNKLPDGLAKRTISRTMLSARLRSCLGTPSLLLGSIPPCSGKSPRGSLPCAPTPRLGSLCPSTSTKTLGTRKPGGGGIPA